MYITRNTTMKKICTINLTITSGFKKKKNINKTILQEKFYRQKLNLY